MRSNKIVYHNRKRHKISREKIRRFRIREKHVMNSLLVREMQIRLVLLNFFPNYVGMFSKTQLEDVILPLVLLGIRDSNDNLVGETLKGTIHILRKHL